MIGVEAAPFADGDAGRDVPGILGVDIALGRRCSQPKKATIIGVSERGVTSSTVSPLSAALRLASDWVKLTADERIETWCAVYRISEGASLVSMHVQEGA